MEKIIMGEIKIKQLKGFLKTAAESANLNGDKKLKGEEEISAFIKTADKLVEVGLVDSNYKETLGLSIKETKTESSNMTNPKETFSAKKNEARLKSTKLDSDQRKSLKEHLKNATTFDEAVISMDKYLTNQDYNYAKDMTKMFIADIKAMKINSKDDVEKIVKNIDKKYDNCDGFNKDIAKLLADIAKKEQISKESNRLVAIYEAVKEANDVDKTFSAYLDAVEYKMDELKLKGSYYKDEAYKGLKSVIKDEMDDYVDGTMRNTNGNTGRTQGQSEKEVRKELRTQAGDDKLLKKFIKKDKTDNILEARYNKYNEITKMLKETTLQDLDDELKNSVVTKLTDSYIGNYANGNGTYDLTSLQAEMANVVGADLMINRSKDTEKAELKHVKDKLKELTGSDFSTKEVKDLAEFLGIEYEKRDRSLKTVLNSALGGIIPGAAGGAVSAGRLNVEQIVRVTTGFESAKEMIGQLGSSVTSTTTNSDGTITLNILQKVSQDNTLFGALAGAGTGALINALTTYAVGVDKEFEKSCFSQSFIADAVNSSSTLEEAQEKIAKKYPGAKGTVLAALAGSIYKEDNAEWKTKYLAELAKISGVGSNANCDETAGAKFAEKAKETKPVVTQAPQEDPHTYDTKDKKAIADKYEKVDTIDARNSSWEKLVEQYDCIKDIDTTGYPACTKRKAELPVRMLKIAQAITDGNYSEERLLELAELSFTSRYYEKLKGIDGLDYGVLVGTMKAQLMSDKTKMPKNLAGCDRVIKEQKANIANKMGRVAAVASADDKVLVAKGSEAKYYAKFDGGEWKEYSDMKARDNAVQVFRKKYPNATIEKKND